MAANALYVLLAPVTYMGVKITKGTTLALTAAQVTAIGAGNLRAVNNPLPVTGTHPASETHDTLGESVCVSNSS
jgi:hypothetical protein